MKKKTSKSVKEKPYIYAWVIYCPPGHEFDYLIEFEENDALTQMDEFNSDAENAGISFRSEIFHFIPC